MKYISTRGCIEPVDFKEAVMMGLSRDGGLLLPESIPDISKKLDEWQSLSYIELALEIACLFINIPRENLSEIINSSYSKFDSNEITPVVKVGDVHILELFHGPTLSFKDVALQFLGNLFEFIMKESGQELNILAATSGDTGSAAIHGVRGKEGIRIFVMHPHGKISASQEKQMTSVMDSNVHNIALEGTFDDCQTVMKSIFGDLEFKDHYRLGAVNSINWARVLAQIVYYFYGYFRVKETTGAGRIRVSVPTGNFGDIFAGYMSVRMGLPISRLVLATNENDILARFFNSGEYSVGDVFSTISPAMDIQVASNFERFLYYHLGSRPDVLAETMDTFAKTGKIDVASDNAVDQLFSAGTGRTDDTSAVIREYYDKHSYLLDPHTAVGVHVSKQFMSDSEPMLCIATAHPAKFSETIASVLGKNIARHPVIDALETLPSKCDVIPAVESAVREKIENCCQAAE